MSGSEQMAPDAKQVLDRTVNGCESLQLSRRLEPAHLAFALTRGLMGDFRTIVGILMRAVNHGGHHRTVGCGTATNLSVMSRRGTHPWRFKSFRKNRMAARRFRRDRTRLSSTSPSSSTARYRQGCRVTHWQTE